MYMTLGELIALAAALAAAALVVVTLKGIRDQLWMMTFAEYTRRYSEIMDGLPFEARRPGGNFSLSGLPDPERQRVLGITRKYLNLCSEDLFLTRKGKIDKETWTIWKTGIKDTMRLPCFQGAWTALRAEYDFFPDFCNFMDKLGGE